MREGASRSGPVTRIWRRYGLTGRSIPAIAPMAADQAPAAQITVFAVTVPRSVTTVPAPDAVAARSMPVT
ncbi:hypothetical protein GCM10012286_65270 [Streptomyces lasiicapitis]|uniref:Uncharacterized protein n=1 Tax=Streptomyces lasiicapitis TaxID=1923961 RepID=A0ABQ2MN45_9ACTN|nr:hypothetical protein GCM10012286_65270 [Streptomyces lasiicapitis]